METIDLCYVKKKFVIARQGRECAVAAEAIWKFISTGLSKSITLNSIFNTNKIERGGYVYILTNKKHTTLYTGVTSNLINRIWEHKSKVHPGSFTVKYNCDILVYYRSFSTIEEAIAAEKAIKAGSRLSKLKLIDVMNPAWDDLYDGLIEEG